MYCSREYDISIFVSWQVDWRVATWMLRFLPPCLGMDRPALTPYAPDGRLRGDAPEPVPGEAPMLDTTYLTRVVRQTHAHNRVVQRLQQARNQRTQGRARASPAPGVADEQPTIQRVAQTRKPSRHEREARFSAAMRACNRTENPSEASLAASSSSGRERSSSSGASERINLCIAGRARAERCNDTDTSSKDPSPPRTQRHRSHKMRGESRSHHSRRPHRSERSDKSHRSHHSHRSHSSRRSHSSHRSRHSHPTHRTKEHESPRSRRRSPSTDAASREARDVHTDGHRPHRSPSHSSHRHKRKRHTHRPDDEDDHDIKTRRSGREQRSSQPKEERRHRVHQGRHSSQSLQVHRDLERRPSPESRRETVAIPDS